jgi:hypothetical protein
VRGEVRQLLPNGVMTAGAVCGGSDDRGEDQLVVRATCLLVAARSRRSSCDLEDYAAARPLFDEFVGTRDVLEGDALSDSRSQRSVEQRVRQLSGGVGFDRRREIIRAEQPQRRVGEPERQ